MMWLPVGGSFAGGGRVAILAAWLGVESGHGYAGRRR